LAVAVRTKDNASLSLMAGVAKRVNLHISWKGLSRPEVVFTFNLFYKNVLSFILSMRFAKIMQQ
jgi:hypothetical protein